jgi:hypothetical protein
MLREVVLIFAGIMPADRKDSGWTTGAAVAVHADCAGYAEGTAMESSYIHELWTYRYADGEDVRPFGDTFSYEMGLGWLWEACGSVEDWGAGPAYGRRYTPEGRRYLAVDGSPEAAPYVDVAANLRDWPPDVPVSQAQFAVPPHGVFMRHVLEHNYDWRVILERALDRFDRRMVLVMFTPFAEGPTHQLRPSDDDYRDLSFNFDELTEPIRARSDLIFSHQTYTGRPIQYGQETIFRIERDPWRV